MKKLVYILIALIHYSAYGVCPGTIPVNTTNSDYFIFKQNPITATYDLQANEVCFSQLTIPPLRDVVKLCTPGATQADYHLVGSIQYQDTENGTTVTKNCTLWSMTPESALENLVQAQTNVKSVADVLFNPIIKKPDGTTAPNPFATTSINEQAVQATLTALGADASLIDYYKKFYFYLEYSTRVDLAARMASLAQQKSVDMFTLLENSSWPGFVKAMTQAFGSWQALETACFTQVTQPLYSSLVGLIKANSWTDLPTSDFWTSIQVTTETIKKSTFWQDYLKYAITNSFSQDQSALNSLKQIEANLFHYIPNLEVAYYQPDFTTLRNSSELFRLQLLLADSLRSRLLPDCIDWQFKDAQGNYDLKQVYTATQQFQQNYFYQVASFAQNNSMQVFQSAATLQFPAQLQPPKDSSSIYFFQESLTLLGMIKNLQGLTQPLYGFQSSQQTTTVPYSLEKTMQTLASTSLTKPSPSIFLYGPDDQYYVEDFNSLHQNIAQAAQQPLTNATALKPVTAPAASTKATTQSWIGSAMGALSSGTAAGVDLLSGHPGSAAQDLEQAGTLVLHGVSQVLSGIDPKKAVDLLANNPALLNELSDDLQKGKNVLQNIGNQIVDAAKNPVGTAEKLLQDVSSVIDGTCNSFMKNVTVGGTGDKELCGDVTGIFQQLVQREINMLALGTNLIKTLSTGVVKLSDDAIHTASKVAVDVITGHYKAAFGDAYSGIQDLGMDIAATTLQAATFTFQFFVEQLIATLKLIQYLISLTVRIFIDATTAVLFSTTSLLETLGAPIDPWAVTQTTNQWLSQHERLISAVIVTGLLVATIPFTDGATIPLIAMVIGPQLFDIYGSYQQDELSAARQHDEVDFVNKYEKYVANNKIIYQQQQADWTDELNLKYQSQLSNQERGLGFYQNLLTVEFEGLKEQMARVLGGYWSLILTPAGSYNLVPANLGTIYGITTQVYELNPSQGFSLYSNARKSYSQEIAVAPALVTTPSDQTLPAQQLVTKNWFNQKELYVSPVDLQEVEIRFKPIYTLQEFYVGLYFGGQALDFDQILKTQSAPLDVGHLAKMAVYKKSINDTSITFGLMDWEATATGWVNDNITSPPFMPGTWYHIKMQLQGTQCTLKVWAEPNEEPSGWQSFTVAQSPSQRVLGVISSGAALEYQIIKPLTSNALVAQLRNTAILCNATPCADTQNESQNPPLQSEQMLEKTQYKVIADLMSPPIGTFNLQAVDRAQILRGHFVYTTKATRLVDQKGVPLDDYVIACTVADGQVSALGKQPQSTDSIASLITNKIFNTDGTFANIIMTNLFEQFVHTYGQLPDSLVTTITTLRTAYIQQMLSITLGIFKLKAYSQEALENHLYVYTAAMVDAQGKPIVDATKKQLSDYMIILKLAGNQPDAQAPFGMAFSPPMAGNSLYGLLSLVSGALYNQASYQPLATFDPQGALNSFITSVGTIPDALQKDITDAQQAYQQAIQPPTPSQSTTSKPVVQPTQSTSISTPTTPSGTGSGNTSQPVQPADQSLQQRTQDASANQDIYGGF